MKRLILTILAASALMSAQAQFFSPEAANGAVWGALAGGIFGGHHPGRAIAIGAASGLFLGSVAHAVNEERYGYNYYSTYPYYGGGYYAYRQPTAYYAPAFTSYGYGAPANSYYAPQPGVAAEPPPQSQPQPIYNHYYTSSSSMSAANALFGR
jgi:hypothetical protein